MERTNDGRAPADLHGTAPAGIAASLRLLPNRITAVRLALLPVLWVLALFGPRALVGPGLLLAAATDVADGIVARRTHTATRFGSAFDSVADHLMTATAAAFLVLLRPAFVREQMVPLAAWSAFALAALAAGWIRHRRIGDLHLYSAKAAGLVGYAFVATLFFSERYNRVFFAFALGLAFVAVAETLAVHLSRREVDEHVGSLLLRRRHPPGERLA
jgi:phosphatidylglycerophosphate synthase